MKRVRSGHYQYKGYDIILDDESESGTYGLWNLYKFDDKNPCQNFGDAWMIEFDRLSDARRFIDNKDSANLW